MSEGLKTPTPAAVKKLKKRITAQHRVMSEVAQREALRSGKKKPYTSYDPKSGRMVREPAFDETRFKQIEKSYMTGQPQANTPADKKAAQFGRRVDRLDRRTRTMGSRGGGGGGIVNPTGMIGKAVEKFFKKV